MTTVTRYDRGKASNAVRLDNGFLRCDANLTRVGVFTYATANGIRRELRLPSEVFNADSMKTFEQATLTNDHPRNDEGESIRVTSKNAKKLSVGTVANLRQDGEFLAADVTITDEDTIALAENGKREVSCGYKCDIEFKSGITNGIKGVPDGLKFDAIQRRIRGNHVALVDRGRAGREASLKLDADDGIMVEDEKSTKADGSNEATGQLSFKQITTGVAPMKVIKVDGVDFEVSEQAAQAFAKVQARADEAAEKLASTEKKISEAEAKADAAEEKVAELEKQKADAAAPEKIQAMVNERFELERTARKILGDKKADEAKLGEMSNIDIKKTVIVHTSPAAKDRMDEADEAYVSARFDQAVESYVEPKPTELHAVRARSYFTNDKKDERYDAEGARQRMVQRHYDIGRAKA